MHPTRILIIDDEVSLALMLKLNLERTGRFEVHTASSGGTGLSEARELRPDLILLDLMMPDMDGTEVADRLAENPRTSDIPIIFLTAVAQKAEVKARGGVIGGRTFIAKPAEAAEVVAAIEKRLERGPAMR
jgi:two-component system sensor histidine kinase/response regulator